MHVVIFGLTISSSWGNGHATLWRSLVRALLQRRHTVSFYERDASYYADARDLTELPPGARLILYSDFTDIVPAARRDVDDADLALCTSFCPDGRAAAELILGSRAAIKSFYDLDTPVTLNALSARSPVDYLPPQGLGSFDLVLSYTGGRALDELRSRLGASVAFPLYGSVDPGHYRLVAADPSFRASLSYLGTYAVDRQQAVQTLFLDPAVALPDRRFLIGGAQYPETFPWLPNVYFVSHVPPPTHPAFFSSCRATLNVTRGVMAEYGFCPSGRLFEAAACAAPLLSDTWDGLDAFFVPHQEILPVRTAADVVDALSLSDKELNKIALAGRARTLQDHTGLCRIEQLEDICNSFRDKTASHVTS
ncbi:CgeB family protein [Granulicella arctica]|uniref:CgeB family protein n=1 Tax=Granulicella arctica TaxID=940613 RepID=UPI0021E08874|nr:glycosyltransferase [Granulicella arctica]